MNRIEEEINERGFYCHSSRDWSEEKDKELAEIRNSLASFKELNISFINEDYFYTWKDNRFKIRIEKDKYGSYPIKGE